MDEDLHKLRRRWESSQDPQDLIRYENALKRRGQGSTDKLETLLAEGNPRLAKGNLRLAEGTFRLEDGSSEIYNLKLFLKHFLPYQSPQHPRLTSDTQNPPPYLFVQFLCPREFRSNFPNPDFKMLIVRDGDFSTISFEHFNLLSRPVPDIEEIRRAPRLSNVLRVERRLDPTKFEIIDDSPDKEIILNFGETLQFIIPIGSQNSSFGLLEDFFSTPSRSYFLKHYQELWSNIWTSSTYYPTCPNNYPLIQAINVKIPTYIMNHKNLNPKSAQQLSSLSSSETFFPWWKFRFGISHTDASITKLAFYLLIDLWNEYSLQNWRNQHPPAQTQHPERHQIMPLQIMPAQMIAANLPMMEDQLSYHLKTEHSLFIQWARTASVDRLRVSNIILDAWANDLI